MSMMYRLLLTLSLLTYTVWCLHDDNSYPYDTGSLTVVTKTLAPLNTPLDPIPIQTRVSYPDREDTYPVWYFIGGLGGLAPGIVYDEIFTKVASHGYIVLGAWPINGIDRFNYTAENHLWNIKWLQHNLERRIPARPSWDNLMFGCHSAGCGPTIEMAAIANNLAAGQIFIEPMDGAIFDHIMNFQQPALSIGTEFAKWMLYNIYYDRWSCPKIMHLVEGVGHCDVLDNWAWQACRWLGLFPVGSKDLVPIYRGEYLQGVVVAFFQLYVHQHENARRYLTQPDLMPVNLTDFDYDFKCRCC